jgi:hypothetical protein
MVERDTVTSVTVRLASTTQAGGAITFSVRTPLANGNPGDVTEILMESDLHTISAQDITNGFVTLPVPEDLGGLPQNRVLEPGDYWLVIDMFSTPTARIMLLDDQTVTMPTFATLMFTDTWYNNGNAVRMRLNFGPASTTGGGQSVNSLNKDLNINVYPNPAKDVVNVAINTNNNLGKVNFQVLDITGRVVATQSTYISGISEVIPVDVAGLQNGVYSIVINTANGYNTSRFVVAH